MQDPLALVLLGAQIAATIALLNGILTTLGQAKVASAALESIARQPEAKDSITSTMIIGLAFAETSGVYGLLAFFILLWPNPIVSHALSVFGG